MKRINVVPMANKISLLGGETTVDPSKLSCKISDSLGIEEYILTVRNDELSLVGGSERALFYGRQTLRQLGASCPCVKIEDSPAFPYRGFMLDTVRHMFSIEDTKKLIDAAASVKMNVMHWHLTDDQGFRIYSEKRPDAAIKGSVRKSSDFGRLKEEGGYGGYFTANQMREIVDYCSDRHITVIPEFDMPGHCSAIIHAHPELSCTGAHIEVKTSQGIFDDILCAGKDGTFEIIFDILSDILDIFPSEYIHIGGDEAPKVRWQECMYCQKRMREEGLKNEETLQGWFTNKIIDFLKSKGRKPLVWNESLKSGVIEKTVLVQRWMDPKNNSIPFTKDGGKIINSDFYHYYCDYPYSMTPLSKTYNYNPIIKGMPPENIVGVEAPIWTEYINNFDWLCHMCFPRFTAVAETGWTNTENKDLSDFIRRFEVYSQILNSIGITPAPSAEWNPNPVKRLVKTVEFFSGLIKKKE